MSIARLACRAQIGLESVPIEVQVHLAAGLPQFNIVGLAATEVKESRDRVRSALGQCGYTLPPGRITVNLAPADLPKDGGRFDLAIALGILLAAGQLPTLGEERVEFLGELGLGGELRGVRGALPTAVAVQRAGHRLIAPRENATELALLPPGLIQVAETLQEVCDWWCKRRALAMPEVVDQPRSTGGMTTVSGLLEDVEGQQIGKLGLEVAAAGEHSILYVGPPGCGKSMLARRLPGILPDMTDDERLQVVMVASLLSPVLSAAPPSALLQRPFRAPHHSASANAIIGGGSRIMPGEISLAHGGVLFLDELPEFDRRVLEALREPLETGTVAIARVGVRTEYPARFQLVAAMNPCPCGYFGSSLRDCRCRPKDVARYRSRLSGPLLDRIDLRVNLQTVSSTESALADRGLATSAPDPKHCHKQVRERVVAARALQLQRQGQPNARLEAKHIERMGISLKARNALQQFAAKHALSLRAQHRILRVARTLADLQSLTTSGPIEHSHIGGAVQLRAGLDGD